MIGASPAYDVVRKRALFYPEGMAEQPTNDGTFHSFPIGIGFDTFTGAVGEDFIKTEKIVVENLPAGLIMRVIKEGANELKAEFLGCARNHAVEDSTDSMHVQFQNAAFNKGNAADVYLADRWVWVRYYVPGDVSFRRYELYQNVAANDSANPDNIVFPGATVRFKVQVANMLERNLLSLTGALRSYDDRVTIIDSVAPFNNVLSGGSGWSLTEYEVDFSDEIAPGDESVLFFSF